MLGFDRIFRDLASTTAVAVLAGAAYAVSAQIASAQTASTLVAPTLSRPVASAVTWPKVSEVERRDGNGVSFYGGVASIDGSDQYGLSVLTFDPFKSSVRATYIDAWALNSPDAASCSVTFRHVERTLTREQADALTPELANSELQIIERDHPGLVKIGERAREGTEVTRLVDKFSWSEDGARVDGLSKSWLFVRLGQAYYVNKICLSKTGLPDLIVIDQLIGLNYQIGDAPIPTPGDVVPENPPPSRPLIYLPPPVGNIAARSQDRQALESQTLTGAEGEAASPPATTPVPAHAPAPTPAPRSPMPTPPTTPQPAEKPAVPATAAPAPVPAATQPAFVSSPSTATPAPAPDHAAARSLTQSLNAGPPTP